MTIREQAQWRWDHIAKPLHSLGQLESMIVQIAAIQGTPDVRLDRRCALIFCADHGIIAEGITQSGSDVTARVAQAIVGGTANINRMAAVAHADVFAVDMGMQADVPGTLTHKMARGTQNMTQCPAMTRAQAEQAIQVGIDRVGEMRSRGYQIILTGEMGIGNTTASTAIACALLNLDPETMTGRGAGLTDEGVARKRHVIQQALTRRQPNPHDPVDVLAKVGGFEIAGMTGAFLGGVRHQIPVVMDGVISAVAALVAARICPEARNIMLASHMSREPIALPVMNALRLSPILHADMALGEGTGAVALLPLLDMALSVYRSSHTFDALGMEPYTPKG